MVWFKDVSLSFLMNKPLRQCILGIGLKRFGKRYSCGLCLTHYVFLKHSPILRCIYVGNHQIVPSKSGKEGHGSYCISANIL